VVDAALALRRGARSVWCAGAMMRCAMKSSHCSRMLPARADSWKRQRRGSHCDDDGSSDLSDEAPTRTVPASRNVDARPANALCQVSCSGRTYRAAGTRRNGEVYPPRARRVAVSHSRCCAVRGSPTRIASGFFEKVGCGSIAESSARVYIFGTSEVKACPSS
jgi:hypothetical protein